MPGEDIARRLLEFAAAIGKTTEELPRTLLGRHVAGQLLRSGTSPGPNYEEARAAESARDFVHKLSVCLKELRESIYWLRYIKALELSDMQAIDPLIEEGTALSKIIGKSIVTVKSRNPRQFS